MTASEILGLSGGTLTTVGVALTLYGLRRIRDSVARFRKWATGRKNPVTIYGEAAVVELTVTARAGGKVRPGPDGWSDDRWHEELDKRIDAVEKELAEHRHLNVEKSIGALRKEAERQQTDYTDRIAAFEEETEVNERWNFAGLGFVLAGTVAQGMAVFV